jgi:hypothetical protein
VENPARLVRQRLPGLGQQARAREFQRQRQQFLGLAPGRLDAGGAQLLGGVAQDLAQREGFVTPAVFTVDRHRSAF